MYNTPGKADKAKEDHPPPTPRSGFELLCAAVFASRKARGTSQCLTPLWTGAWSQHLGPLGKLVY